MTIDELFSKLRNNIPLTPNSNKPFHQHLHDNFENFRCDLQQLNSNEFHEKFHEIEKEITLDNFIDIENEICNKIEDVILQFRKGYLYDAYAEFSKILEDSFDILGDMLYNSFKVNFSNTPKELYRVRYTQIIDKYSFPDNMKHCPFEKVHNLGNFRFSISGFPCLYLGSSLKVCKAEVSPKFEEEVFYQAKYLVKNINHPKRKKPDNLLLLSLVPPTDASDNESLFNFFLLYPLFLACLARKKNENGKFHQEYIIPQLLLEFVRKSELLHGIEYISTHMTKEDSYSEMTNYVFPVREINDEGFDEELMKWFDMTLLDAERNPKYSNKTISLDIQIINKA